MRISKKFRLFLFTLALIMPAILTLGNAQAALPAPLDEQDISTVEQPAAAAATTTTQERQKKLPVYFFWGDGCPHCRAESIFLQKIKNDYPHVEFHAFEVYRNQTNFQLLLQMTKERDGREANGVPVLIIGDKTIIGFRNEQTTGTKIKQLLDIYTLGNIDKKNDQANDNIDTHYKEIVKYPLIGKIKLEALSLPLLTLVLGTLDGFNPCSMWALIVLITLLINTGSRKKMWLVGGIFIITSAISYFLFLIAWLNTFLLIGYLLIVRIIIGGLSIGVGIYFLRDYIKKRKQNTLTCEVTSAKTKNKIIQRLQNILQKKSILTMIFGVILIAFSVNLIELMCSAGIPAIYTQILSQNHLPKMSYYLYLLAYDFFYMLDDIVILLIAGFTWQLLQNTGKYTKYSHLIGGILLLILGFIMLINPNLLMFK